MTQRSLAKYPEQDFGTTVERPSGVFRKPESRTEHEPAAALRNSIRTSIRKLNTPIREPKLTSEEFISWLKNNYSEFDLKIIAPRITYIPSRDLPATKSQLSAIFESMLDYSMFQSEPFPELSIHCTLGATNMIVYFSDPKLNFPNLSTINNLPPISPESEDEQIFSEDHWQPRLIRGLSTTIRSYSFLAPQPEDQRYMHTDRTGTMLMVIMPFETSI